MVCIVNTSRHCERHSTKITTLGHYLMYRKSSNKPRGLIWKKIIFGWGLIRGGAYSSVGAYLKIYGVY